MEKKTKKRKGELDVILEEMVAAKKERNEIIKQVLISPKKSPATSERDPIQIQCDLFALSMMALPSDLRKKCKREMQAIIEKHEEEAESSKSANTD